MNQWAWHHSLFGFLAFSVIMFTAYKCGYWEGRENMVNELSDAFNHRKEFIVSTSTAPRFGQKAPPGYEPYEPEMELR